jgi:hypothetical protein
MIFSDRGKIPKKQPEWDQIGPNFETGDPQTASKKALLAING